MHRPLELTSLYDDLAKAGQKQRTDVLAFDRRPAGDEVAAELQLSPGEDVWYVERLRFVR